MIELLKHRFLENMVRHPNLDWEKFLRNNPKAIQTLRLMEESGGEPDLLQLDSGELIFCDCSQESPALRRSLCYDNEALSLRKKNPPAGSAMAQASQMGLELLTESLYRQLQETGEYDTKTSSWIALAEHCFASVATTPYLHSTMAPTLTIPYVAGEDISVSRASFTPRCRSYYLQI